MRELANRRTAANYESGVDWPTQLSVQSDLVVYGKSVDAESGGTASKQKQQFIFCDVNIEMKRFRYLLGRDNKSPMTQVAAQSYARKSQLDDPKILYSILTDCCGLYALCHFITPEGESDKYWISRREIEPKRVVAVLRWLLLNSRKDAAPNLQAWKVATSGLDVQNSNETGDCDGDDSNVSKAESGDSREPLKKRARKTTKGRKPEGRAKRSSNDSQVREGLKVADILFGEDESDDDEGGVDWSHFYALQTQRQTGPKFHFAGGFLPA